MHTHVHTSPIFPTVWSSIGCPSVPWSPPGTPRKPPELILKSLCVLGNFFGSVLGGHAWWNLVGICESCYSVCCTCAAQGSPSKGLRAPTYTQIYKTQY